jgi:hypothetical protein
MMSRPLPNGRLYVEARNHGVHHTLLQAREHVRIETDRPASTTTQVRPSPTESPQGISRTHRWFVSGDGIDRAVITADIQRYLGPEASVVPGISDDISGIDKGIAGYWVTAYRIFTSHQLQDLKSDSALWRAATNKATISSSPADFALPCAAKAERYGWQLGLEKFLWDTEATTPLITTQRGMLGRGSIGEVEEVHVPGYAQVMARKRIFISRVKHQAVRERRQIRTEVENLMKLNHLHIIKVLGCYQERRGSSSFAVCALLHPSGDEDLGVFLHERCANSLHDSVFHTWIRGWFFCLASALAYMHSQGIHHEDIKPSNIIHRNGTVYFTDFSSSRRLEIGNDTSTASPAMASRLFAAPEALCDDAGNLQRHGSKTDVFSLGLVFLEMYAILWGMTIDELQNLLFGAGTAIKQYHRVVHKFTEFRMNYPPGSGLYTGCISRMLLLQRTTRPSAAEVVILLLRVGDIGLRNPCVCRANHESTVPQPRYGPWTISGNVVENLG